MWKLDGLIVDGELVGGRGEGCGLLIEVAMVEMETSCAVAPANWLRGLCGVAGFVPGSCHGRLASAARIHSRPTPTFHQTWRSGHTDRNQTKEHTRRMMPAGQSGEGTLCSTHNSRRQLTPPSVPATKGNILGSQSAEASNGSTITVVGRSHWPGLSRPAARFVRGSRPVISPPPKLPTASIIQLCHQ
jgi:hypothetical protein